MRARASRLALLVGLLAATAPSGCTPPDAGREDPTARAFLRIVEAEDMRPAGGARLATLVEATRHPSPQLRLAGVRALGRLERPQVADRIVPLLADGDARVRAEAANALAQAYHGRPGAAALAPLVARTRVEEVPTVRGVLARSIGRLRLGPSREAERERTLLALGRGPAGGGWPSPAQLTGAVLGMESAVRAQRGAVGGALVSRLEEAARYRGPGGAEDASAARVREVALLALAGAGALDPALAGSALDDADAAVRRASAATLARSGNASAALVERILADPSPQVRFEGVRALASSPRDRTACARLETLATDDADLHVRLAALDALGAPCPDAGASTLLLREASALPPGTDAAWHAPAHALLALASLDRRRAAPLLPGFAGHASPFVRAWAAQAATVLRDVAVLRRLATDSDANTRAAALDGLARTEGRAADGALLAALDADDAPQVILALVPHLAATDSVDRAITASVAALGRLRRTGTETLRDPRLALLDLVGLLGDERSVPALDPFVNDFDPVVADRAAEVLRTWTWRPWLGAGRRRARLPLPSPAALQAMAGGEVVLHMRRGGTVRIRLLPWEAPTNAFRLWEMARRGDLDGLTFHRVVPNFVIQGGSPLANEYGGHGAFTRDEVGQVVQWRGTVGVSTRGRDTGDGQIYVNLVDNVRLDHDYTVLGVVSEGMEVVDAVREGDVIERAEILPPSS